MHTWTPQNLPNGYAWWDLRDESTMTIAGGRVTAVADKRGTGRTLVEASSSGPADPAGQGYLEWTGTEYLQILHGGSFLIAQPNVLAVRVWMDGFSRQCVYDGTSNAGRHMLEYNALASAWGWLAGSNNLTATGLTTDQWQVWVASFNGASSSLRLNGSEVDSGNTGTQSMTGIRLGAKFNLADPLFGRISEVVVSDELLSADDMAALEQYLQTGTGPALPHEAVAAGTAESQWAGPSFSHWVR